MPTKQHLIDQLQRIDGKGYGAYKDLQGKEYQFDEFTLTVDYVQGDPFAAPSRLRVRVPQGTANFPGHTFQSESRQVALQDYLIRQFARAAGTENTARGSGKSGSIGIDRPGQQVLWRTAVSVTETYVEARFTVGLPAQGRRVLGKQAAAMLAESLPRIVASALRYDALDADELTQHIETVEDADALRDQLRDRGLTAFVADEAILPRRSGVDERPMHPGARPFRSPESLRVTLHRPNAGDITGMGAPTGVTLIVGGGYHGKSTLLKALEQGVYDHIPGDGREWVVADPAAVKIRAEDGRSVSGVDISPFIDDLPGGAATRHFSSENASGSTSQAANIMEMLEAGARTFLIDEDTSATNFMIRDHRMQELIGKDKEPITPFVDKIRQLYADHGVSTVLVMGGSGDYFEHADTVIAMEEFAPYDVTERAGEIADTYKAERSAEGGDHFGSIADRVPRSTSIDPAKGKKPVDVKTRGRKHVQFGIGDIDLAGLEQLVDESQTRAIAQGLVYMKQQVLPDARALTEALDRVETDIAEQGLDVLAPGYPGDLAAPRRFELAAALNRLRTLEIHR
jgi:predicted ABC-class ATPase